MINRLAVLAALILLANSSQAVVFHAISSIDSSTQATDLWPVSNLIQGPGVGFEVNEPHDKLLGGSIGNWVTADPGGFPSDYIAVAGMPVFTIDLGLDVLLAEISVWGYQATNANGVSEFSLRFATEADSSAGFGTSIGFNPTYFPINDDLQRQSFAFGQTISARYVEFTAKDNFFIAPGDGSGGEAPGGDRVGLGEIAFSVSEVPVPATVWLFGSSLLGLIGMARRKKA
jgi:hypothetical protein